MITKIKAQEIVQDDNLMRNLLKQDYESGIEYQRRRWDAWTQNYINYRNKPQVDMFTQRQSITYPFTKETITIKLSNIDDDTEVKFTELSGDKQREIYKNEYWKFCTEENDMELIDIQDKKQVMLYGRSYIKMNIMDGRFVFEAVDPMDILISKYTDPKSIDSSPFLIQRGIYRSLRRLMQNERYDPIALSELETYYYTEQGLIEASTNKELLERKNERMVTMGYTEQEVADQGDVVVELMENYKKIYDEEQGREVIWYFVTCKDKTLYKEELRKLIYPEAPDEMYDFYPYESWAEDIETLDWYSDGTADIIRPINKSLNILLSAKIESAIYATYGMNFYNASADPEFDPSMMTPRPFGFYPMPGNPNEILKRVDINEIQLSTDILTYIKTIGETATSSNSVLKGVKAPGVTTLGEFQGLLSQNKETITSIAKFYRRARKKLAQKWSMITDYNPDLEAVKIYKESVDGKMYDKELSRDDWKSKLGYKVTVKSTAEAERDDIQALTKYSMAKQVFQGNRAFDKILKDKTLSILGTTEDEYKQIMEEEDRLAEVIASQPTQPQIPGQETPGAPGMDPKALSMLAGGGQPQA